MENARGRDVPNEKGSNLSVELVLLAGLVLVADRSSNGVVQIDLSIDIVPPRGSIGIYKGSREKEERSEIDRSSFRTSKESQKRTFEIGHEGLGA